MAKGFDIYSIIGILIAIALAIFSPNMPKISSTGTIIWLAMFIVMVLVVIIINFYLNSQSEREIMKNQIESINKSNKDMDKEIIFLKERFKTLEELTEVRTEIKAIKKRLKL